MTNAKNKQKTNKQLFYYLFRIQSERNNLQPLGLSMPVVLRAANERLIGASVCVFVCFQVDAEGAGALVMPYALADLGHGMCRLHVRLLFPREVPTDTSCPRSRLHTINPVIKHQFSSV